MSAVGMRARAELRHRAASVIVLTLITGIVGGVAMAAFSGARRTDTSYQRYRDAVQEPEVIVAGCENGLFPSLDLQAVDRLPTVASTTAIWLANPAGALLRDGKTAVFGDQDPFEATVVAPEATDVAGLGSSLKIIEGRLPTASDEVALPWGQGSEKVRVGDTILIRMISSKATPEDLFSGEPPSPDAYLPDVPVTVTGIVLTPQDLGGTDSTVLVTRAFYERYASTAFSCEGRTVQLERGLADIPPFEMELSKLSADAFYFDLAQEAVIAERQTHLRAIVMRLFGWLMVVAGLLIVGQALVRRTVLAATEDPIMRALGMSRRQITAVPLVGGAIVGIGGALIAVLAALAAAPYTETGLARFIDPDPGVRFDPVVMLVGAAVIFVVALLLTGIPAWRLAGARGSVTGTVELPRSSSPSRLASLFSTLALPASAIAGSRLALEPGHGRTAVPVRSAIVGLALSVAAMTAAFGFAASMQHFAATPALWGVQATFGTGSPFSGKLFEKDGLPVIERDPGISDLSAGNFQNAVFLSTGGDAVSVAAWGLEPVRGPILAPTMLAGRWPATSDEIAVGSVTLRDLGAHIGDQVKVVAGGEEHDLTVVGVPVFPDFGFGPGFGQGAGLTFEGLRTFYPGATRNLALGRYGPDVDPRDVARRLNPTLRHLSAVIHPDDLAQLGESSKDALRSRDVPLVLASLFAIAALATLMHVLITSVRRRRSDLAILRTLGFTRRQVTSTVAWQAGVLALAALCLGVPFGILVGRLGWTLFAERLGVVPAPVVAWPQALLAIPITIALAVVISLGPAIAARRTQPAQVLRAE